MGKTCVIYFRSFWVSRVLKTCISKSNHPLITLIAYFHLKYLILSIVVQLLGWAQCFVTPWTAAHQASLSFIISQSLLKLMSIELMMSSIHLILCCPCLFLPQYFPASGSFPLSLLFASGGQSIGTSTSASVLPMNIQSLFPLGLTGLISLLSKGLSNMFTSTTVQKHPFFIAQHSVWSHLYMTTVK